MIFSRFRASYTVLLVASCLIVSCTGAVAQGTPTPGAKTVLPVFQSVVQQLHGKTQVPIVLPTQIPTANPGHTYAYLLDSAKDSYTLTLDTTPDCRGKDYCDFGILTAQQVYQNTPSVRDMYAFELSPKFQPTARSPEQQGEVQLSNGITGYFVPYICSANCDTSKLFWEQDGYRYSVGIEVASQAAMVKMANSAIENER